MFKKYALAVVAVAAVGLFGAALAQQIISINSTEELNKLPKEIEWTGGPIQPPMSAQAPAQSVTSPSPKPFTGRPLDGGSAGTIGGQAISVKDLHVIRNTGKMFPRPTTRVNDYVKGQLVIGFKTSMRGKYNCSVAKDGILKTGIKTIDALNAKYGARGQKKIHEYLFPAAYTYGLDLHHVFYVDEKLDLEAVAREYRSDPSVQFAHPDYIPMVKCLTQAPWAQTGVYEPKQVAPSYPNDPMFDWAPNILQVPRARTVTGAYGNGDGTGGARPDTLLMLDPDQIRITHEEFANNRIVATGGTSPTGTAADQHGHMCMAHAIGAMNNSVGIAGPGGGNGTTRGIVGAYYRYTSSSDNATGISWGVGLGVCAIAQASLYFANTEVLEAAFKAALDAGAPAYISAGNDRNTESNMYPAYYDCVTAVGGIDWFGRHWAWDDSSGSCYGDWVDIVAPGDAHWSANSGADNAYTDGYGGTSWAAPEVAAIAALCHHVTGLTGRELQNAVLRTANSNDHINASLDLWTIEPGWGGTGIANAYEAVTVKDRNVSVDFVSANSANNNYLNHGDMYLQSYMQPNYDPRDTLFYNAAMFQSKMRQVDRTIVPDVTIYPKAMVHNRGKEQVSFNVTATNSGTYTSTKTVTLGSGKGTLVTFDGWTPTGTGTEVLTVYTDLVGDQNRFNDTVKLNLTKALRDTVYMDDGSFDAGYTDNNAKWLVRFVPERTCTLAAVQWMVKSKKLQGGAPSTSCSLLVYSDNNGKPGTKLYAQNLAWNQPPAAGSNNVWTTTTLTTAQLITGPVHIGFWTLGAQGDTLTIGFDYRKGSAVTHFSTDNGVTWSELGNDMAVRPIVGYRTVDANDVGVVKITEPQGQLTKGFGYTPKAVIKNYASNTATNFTVRCRIDSVGASTVNKYLQTITITLAPGRDTTVQFTPYVPGGSGATTYNVRASMITVLSGDAVTANDSIATPLLTVAQSAQFNTGYGTPALYSPDGYIYVFRCNAAAPGQVTSVDAQFYSPGSANAACSAYVFADNGGVPGTQLGAMEAVNLDYGSWTIFTFGTPIDVPAGYFWAGVKGNQAQDIGPVSDNDANVTSVTRSSLDKNTWYTETTDYIIRCNIVYSSSPNNDLGIVSLDAPSTVIYPNFSVTPKATVKNGGKTALSGVNVVCVMRNAYDNALIDSSARSVSLNPNQSTQLSFAPLTPTVDSIWMKVKRLGTDDASSNDSLLKKIYTSQLTEIDYSGGPSKLWIIDAADGTYDTLYRAVRFSPDLPCSLVGMWHFIYRTQTTQAWRACSLYAWDRTEGYKNWPADRYYLRQEYTPSFTGYGGWVRTSITPTFIPSGRDFWLGAWTPPLAASQCSIFVTTDYWGDAGRSFIRWNPRDSASNGYNYVWLPMWNDWNISALVKYLGGPSRTVKGLVSSVTSEDSLSFRTYLAKNLDQVIAGNVSGASITLLPGNQALWQFDAKHFWPSWNRGDTMVVIVDREVNSGTINHAGYYAVMNDTLIIDVSSQTMNTATLRAIPVPVASMEGSNVRLRWPKPAYDAGKPNLNPIIGYRIYRSTDGFNFTALGTTTSYNDTTYLHTSPPAGTAYYAIKLRYLGSALSKDGDPKAVVIESKYLSGNSNPINPLGVAFSNMTALVSSKNVTLQWRTESEQNSYQWLVERSDDGGNTYRQVGVVPARGNSTSPTDYSYEDRNLAGGRIYFYRLGEQDLNGSVTYYGPLQVGPLVGRPTAYALGPAQPNPFNRTTSINYQIKESGRVSLKVYSITGQLIKTLVDAVQEADYYTAVWDGTNDRGQKVAAGVYLYRIDAGGFRDMKKALFLR